MDYSTGNDPTISQPEVSIETEVCAFDGKEYLWFLMVSVWSEDLQESVRVYKGNLEKWWKYCL